MSCHLVGLRIRNVVPFFGLFEGNDYSEDLCNEDRLLISSEHGWSVVAPYHNDMTPGHDSILGTTP